MEVLLRELLARIGLLSLVRNSRRVFGGQKVVMSSSGCESTKGLVCPSLAHALHSQNLRSLREGGPWKERSLPLGPEPGLPLCQPHLGDAWCSGSLLQ